MLPAVVLGIPANEDIMKKAMIEQGVNGNSDLNQQASRIESKETDMTNHWFPRDATRLSSRRTLRHYTVGIGMRGMRQAQVIVQMRHMTMARISTLPLAHRRFIDQSARWRR